MRLKDQRYRHDGYHQFFHQPVDSNDATLERYAQAFILVLIGSTLFTDKKGTHIHMCYLPLLRDLTQTSIYSWGSTVLAHLYRELCRTSLDGVIDITRCVTLLQV